MQLEKINKLLTDPQLTSVRLVLYPEKMVVKEAQRAYTYLNLYGYATDAVVCNRMLPTAVTDGYFTAWKAVSYTHLIRLDGIRSVDGSHEM